MAGRNIFVTRIAKVGDPGLERRNLACSIRVGEGTDFVFHSLHLLLRRLAPLHYLEAVFVEVSVADSARTEREI